MYVYVMKAGDKCKIGKARKPEQRLAELQTGNPLRLELVATIPCKSDRHALAIEKLAHRLFKADGRVGEWFWYSGPIARFVAHCNQAAEGREIYIRKHRELDRQFWDAVARGE